MYEQIFVVSGHIVEGFMELFNFSLVLSGVDINTPDLENKLFESGCDDALICFHGASVYVEFDRYSTDLKTAIESAIMNVNSAGFSATQLENVTFSS